MGYSKSAFIGVTWLGVARIMTRFGSFARTAILARLLTPAQFGLFGMAALVLSFLEIMMETGINVVLIQEKKSISKFIDTAWVISIIRGFLISFAIVLTIPFVIKFFNYPDLKNYLLLLSTVPIIRGFINPAIVNFQKDLKFHLEFRYRTVVFFIDAIVAIVVTFFIRTPMGMIYGLIAGAISEVIFSQTYVRPRPKFKLTKSKARVIIGRGKWMTLAGVFNYFSSHGDDAIVGKLLNNTSLGLYQVGYKISTLPLTEVTELINRVTLPVYVQISDDRKRLKRAFLRTFFAVFIIVVPVGLVIYLCPSIIIRIMLGDQWLGAAAVLKVLAVFGVVRAMVDVPHSLFLSLRKQKVVAISMFLETLGLAIFIVPLVISQGIVGAANAAIFSTLFSLPYLGFMLYKEFEYKIS